MSQRNSMNSICVRSAAGRRLTAALLGIGLLSGCGGDDSSRRTDALQAANATAGTGGDVESGGAGGGAAEPPPVVAPPVVADPNAPSGAPLTCAMAAPPADGTLINMNEYNVPTPGNWGDSAMGGHITGGTSLYSCNDDGVTCPATAVMTPTLTDGLLNLKATVPPTSGYTGVVLWFGPCIAPTAYAGFSMVIGGDLAGTRLLVKPQQHTNYPVDVTNMKGGCEYPMESGKWSTCVPPEFIVTTVTTEPTAQSFLWSDFTGGLPLQDPPLDPARGMVGLELQFQCQAMVDCALDVNLGNIMFIPPAM